ncbi:DUF2442 domain-containing protein [Nostoc sp. TCL26-01]|uniref:DUF2442 domain-containing protein n=1 Tax=Nostoc sp. TCL26-01 TaxID=2576904 RepID=UPI0015B91F70|nr:DUF2442 domain-containing protein [Nostoc sp. TCL26-01]QLE56641.1 DUF2442 domain-containing protein [Nostoc sp. TCL26-01]
MLKDIIEVIAQDNHQLYLKFEDGQAGIVDVKQLIEFTGIFAPLEDLEYFRTVKLNDEWGTIHWDSGADLDPDVLYAVVTKQPIPTYRNYEKSCS